MKTSLLSFFCLLLIFGCKPIQEVEPIAPNFQTTCLLSKKQVFYPDINGNLKLQTEETYQYDSLKRIIAYLFFYDASYDTTRYDISFKDIYQYDVNGFLTEKIRKGLIYNGYSKREGTKPSPVGIISGKTTFSYQNGLLVKEEAYRKVDAQFLMEFVNPRTDTKLYEYDAQGKISKYRNQDADSYWGSYFLNNGKIIKSETDYYDGNAKKLVMTDEFNQWGLITQSNRPKIYNVNGSFSRMTNEVGDYDKFTYDGYGRRIKFDIYRQEGSVNNGILFISDNATLWRISDYQYEDTALPETTLPLPKGHPKIPDFQGNLTYNLRLTTEMSYLFATKEPIRRVGETLYSYTYNNEKLPVNVVITNNSYDNKGKITNTDKSVIKYEYVGCK